MKYYKITNKREIRHGMSYKDGLNEDILPFYPSGDCQPGGIYFAREDIFAFLMCNLGYWVREVVIPAGEEVYQNQSKLGYPKTWKTHKLILKPRKKITLEVIKSLVKEGANIHSGDEVALTWASRFGYFDIVKFLVRKGADVNARWCKALRHAAEHNHKKIVIFLVKKGADIHVDNNRIIKGICCSETISCLKELNLI